jgi:hypothetical protein
MFVPSSIHAFMKHPLLLLWLVLPLVAHAQSDSLTTSPVVQSSSSAVAAVGQPTPKPLPRYRPGFALMLSAGTAGGGFAVGYSIARPLAVRLGANLFSFGGTLISGKDSDDIQIGIDYKLKLQTVNLLVDYYPFKRTGVRLTGGVFYNLNQISFFGTPTKDVKFNDVVFTAAEVGTVDGGATFSKIAPYLGLGFGNPYTRHRLKFMFDLGLFYQQSPQITFVTTGLLEPSNDQGPVIENNLRPLKYYPVITFGLAYKL